MFNPPKYKLISAPSEAGLESKLNALNLRGYQLLHFGLKQNVEDGFSAIMEFQELRALDYEDVVGIQAIPLSVDGVEVEEKLRDGWQILSHYAKHVIVVKRTVDPAEDAQPPADEDPTSGDFGDAVASENPNIVVRIC